MIDRRLLAIMALAAAWILATSVPVAVWGKNGLWVLLSWPLFLAVGFLVDRKC